MKNITNEELLCFFNSMNACEEMIEWAIINKKDLYTFFEECERGDWLE
jgi:hypothetical protein